MGAGAVLTMAGCAMGLRHLESDKIARTGIMSACFFVASLIHVPIGPSSVHLLFNGAVGLILGWAAFPALLVALILQAVFFQFGGITTLGINTFIMAFPAVIGYILFRALVRRRAGWALPAAFFTGAFSVFLSGVLAALALMFTEDKFINVAGLVIGAHVPVMLIEGIMTVFLVAFLKRVQPDMLPSEGPSSR